MLPSVQLSLPIIVDFLLRVQFSLLTPTLGLPFCTLTLGNQPYFLQHFPKFGLLDDDLSRILRVKERFASFGTQAEALKLCEGVLRVLARMLKWHGEFNVHCDAWEPA